MEKTKKYLWIDSLKGFACLLVMITHIIAFDSQIGMYANGCGKIGVWLFMLISGILYAKSAFHQIETLTLRSLCDYYQKRIVRIYPSYLFALLIVLSMNFITFSGVKDNLVFLNAWGHLWYMPVIIKFYLLAPFFTVLKHVTDKADQNGRIIFCFLLTAIAIVFAVIFPYSKYPENSIQLYWYIPVFIGGVILGTLKWENNRQSIWLDIGAIIGIVVILVLTPLGRELLFGQPLSRYLQNKYILISSCWGLVILGIVYGKKTRQIIESIPGLAFVSKYSFELYLIHYILLCWINSYRPMDTWLRGLITIIVSFLVAIPFKKALDWINMKTDKRIRVGIIVLMYTVMVVLGYIV